jgi:hypothetical protein
MLQAFVQLDPKLQEYIALGVTFAVSWLILQITVAIPWLGEYIGQHKVGIITWLTGLLVQLTQDQLNKIPASYDTLVTLVMQLVVQVLVIFVGFAFLAKRGARALK